MRHIAFALLAASPVILIATMSSALPPATVLLPHFLVEPGPVTGDRSAGINGSFTLTQAAAPNGGPQSGITSDQLGGACIIFRVQDLNYHLLAAKSCTQDSDCETTEDSAHYCQPGTGQCWARPAAFPDPLCNRSIDYSPPQAWTVGEVNPISAGAIPVASYQLAPNSQAVVVALTRGKGGGAPHNVLTWGQPTTIP